MNRPGWHRWVDVEIERWCQAPDVAPDLTAFRAELARVAPIDAWTIEVDQSVHGVTADLRRPLAGVDVTVEVLHDGTNAVVQIRRGGEFSMDVLARGDTTHLGPFLSTYREVEMRALRALTREASS